MADESPQWTPPYISFATVLNQLERMQTDGVPGKIDKFYLTGMAGGTQAQFKHALRNLGLIDQDDRSTPVLVRAAESEQSRKEVLAEVLRAHFPQLTGLDANASKGQAFEAMAPFKFSSDTARKALGFFVAAAEYAGIPVSTHIKGARSGGAPGAPRRPRRPKAAKQTQPPVQVPPSAVNAEGHRTTVDLGQAGRVTLVVDVNPLLLSKSDRAFFYGLVDAMEERRDAVEAPKPRSAQSGSDGSAGDQGGAS